MRHADMIQSENTTDAMLTLSKGLIQMNNSDESYTLASKGIGCLVPR